MGPVLGPHARNDRTRDTRAAEPRLPAPEDVQPREGQRLTPDAPRNDGRHPPRGRPSATPTTSNAPPHQRTSHGTSAPHPLLLGTATQQWRNPGRGTRGHQGTGTQRRRRRPPTTGRGHGLRPGGSTGALHGRCARGACSAGGQRAHPLTCVETGPLHRRRLAPQTAPSARPR